MVTPEDNLPPQTEEDATKSEIANDNVVDENVDDSVAASEDNPDKKGDISEEAETSEETNSGEASGDNSGEANDEKTQENGNTDNKEDIAPAPQAAPDGAENAQVNAGDTTPTESIVETPKIDPPPPNSPPKEKPSSKSTTFVHDPNKITLRFLFAGRDGTHVIIDCKPNDTVGEVKGALMSVWPEDLPECSGGDRLRLICMGKGILMPDSKTLQAADVPVFKTHPTPINVSVRPPPENKRESLKYGSVVGGAVSGRTLAAGNFTGEEERNANGNSSGCCCVIC